ncbi:S-adenosyl-L-methionine-dependent methyltransferase [Cunninghamella echinulata]|nr:S-adenosyl-L-methionine-dependent methyltransferase [Cunninghamella echinulata]
MSLKNIGYKEEMISFQYKDGRKVVDDDSIAYILPSDATEVERLRMTLGGLYKAPMHEALTKGIQVLDIGCGPGFWTRDMARLYPNSKFIGIDMANVFATNDLPPNLEFKIINAVNGLPFEDESFHFVFQRFLVMGFPTDQYKNSIQELKRVLKKGGVIEILELVNDYKNAPPSLVKISSWIDDALTSRGMDSFIADKISSFLNDSGFNDIQDINYTIPIGEWGGDSGKLYLSIQHLALAAVGVMVTKLTSVTEKEYKETLNEAFNSSKEYNISNRFRLVYGKKP